MSVKKLGFRSKKIIAFVVLSVFLITCAFIAWKPDSSHGTKKSFINVLTECEGPDGDHEGQGHADTSQEQEPRQAARHARRHDRMYTFPSISSM